VQGIKNPQAFLRSTLFAQWRKSMASNEQEPSTPDEDELIELIKALRKTIENIERRLQPKQPDLFDPNDHA
jgi:hypothetical protein